MKLNKKTLTNISSLPTAVISLIISFFIPLVYFVISYEYMKGTVHTEMAFSARAVEAIVISNPKSWQFEETRLQEILERRLDHDYHDKRKIIDLQGQVIAETGNKLIKPVLTFSEPVFDSGTEVARIEIERSIFPLVARTTLIGMCSFGGGIVIFLIYYFFPLRTIREAYERLQQSEKKYRLITEKMADIVWVADMDLQTLYITPSVQLVLGFSSDEMPRTVEEQLTPESLMIVKETLVRELETERRGDADPDRTVSLVLEYYHKDRSTRWLETVISGIRDDKGALTGFQGVFRDITKRKVAEESLRKSEELYTRLVRSIPDIIIRTDLKANILFVNDKTLQISGYRRDEVEGRNLLSFVDIKDREKALRDLQRVTEGHKLGPVEYDLLTKDGKRIPLDINGDVLRNEEGKPFGFVCVCRDISERKRAEEALSRSEEKYRTIIESIEDGYAELDLNGNFLFVNDALCKIDGYPKNELMKLNYRDIMDDKNAKAVYEAYHKVFVTGEPERNVEYEIVTKKGVVKYLETSVSPIKDVNNRIIAFRGIVRDRTENRKAEDKFRKIFMTAPDCIVITRISDGTIIDVNKGFEDIVGWQREQVIGISSADPVLNFWADLSEKSFIYADLRTGRDVLNHEFEFRRRDGAVRSAICSARPIKIGEEDCVLFILQDITERKLAEEKFYKVFMTTPNCVAITRLKDGYIKDVNKGFEEILGWRREIAVGTKSFEPPLNFWVNISDRDFMAAELKRGRDIFHRLMEFRRSDGSVRTGVYSARPINIDGEESVIFILQDITEQKRMERELVESQKTSLLNQIASGVAHEVRNPLHAIQAISEAMAVDMDEKSDYKDYLMHIRAQVQRLSHLMNDLLDLGKPIQSSLFSKSLLTDIAAASLGYWMEAHTQHSGRVRIVNKLEQDEYVMADSNKIQQVIINLIENAIQNSPRSEEVLLELSKASGIYLMVKVIDSGAGLKSVDESKIFEPFYTTRKGGTGLGLSLCKHIIENHGGKIDIVNNQNAPGCTARFIIPAYDNKEPS